jgi:hypothetical protein
MMMIENILFIEIHIRFLMMMIENVLFVETQKENDQFPVRIIETEAGKEDVQFLIIHRDGLMIVTEV